VSFDCLRLIYQRPSIQSQNSFHNILSRFNVSPKYKQSVYYTVAEFQQKAG